MDTDRLLKHLVNGITASGGALSAVAIAFAFDDQIQTAWILLGIGVIIDSVDGTLVRAFGLEETLTRYDGDQLDEFADLLTFVAGPVGVAWASEILPFTWPGILTGMIVCAVSILQFSRTENKTESAFWGWPSYWNVVFFYGWGLGVSSAWVVGVTLVLSAGVFAPIPFVYPSRLPVLRKTTWVLGLIWAAVLFAYIVYPGLDYVWLLGSLAFPLYYLVLSAVLHDRLKDDGDADTS